MASFDTAPVTVSPTRPATDDATFACNAGCKRLAMIQKLNDTAMIIVGCYNTSQSFSLVLSSSYSQDTTPI